MQDLLNGLDFERWVQSDIKVMAMLVRLNKKTYKKYKVQETHFVAVFL